MALRELLEREPNSLLLNMPDSLCRRYKIDPQVKITYPKLFEPLRELSTVLCFLRFNTEILIGSKPMLKEDLQRFVLMHLHNGMTYLDDLGAALAAPLRDDQEGHKIFKDLDVFDRVFAILYPNDTAMDAPRDSVLFDDSGYIAAEVELKPEEKETSHLIVGYIMAKLGLLEQEPTVPDPPVRGCR